MTLVIPIYTKVGKRVLRVLTTASSKIPSGSYNTQNTTLGYAKPAGWNEAKPYSSIPGPKGLPFIGNNWRFLPFIGDLHGLHLNEINKLFHTRYGNISRLGDLTIKDLIMIDSPEDIEYLFRNEGIHPIRDAAVKTFGYYKKNVRADIFKNAPGVSAVHGKEWQEMRSKLNPILMHPQTILQYASGFDTIANQLVQKMLHLANLDPNNEMPDNFSEVLNYWTLEAITFVCVDKQLGCLDPNLPEDSEQMKIIKSIFEMFPLFYKLELQPSIRNVYKTKNWRRYVELMDYISFTFLRYVEEAIIKINEKTQDSTQATTILQQLLKLDDKSIAISTAIELLTGGVDTTGKVMGSGLYYLAKFPEAQVTLREELKMLLPKKDTPITKEVLSKASYLRACFKEITRLAPIAVGNGRQTVKDMVICGYQIPKGTNVLASNLLLSHSDEYYPEAKKFIPERWLRSTTGELSAKSANPFITLPFGYGPRSCIGKRLASLEIEIAIAKVVRNFYLEWHHKDMTFKGTPFYGVNDPLKLCIRETED